MQVRGIGCNTLGNAGGRNETSRGCDYRIDTGKFRAWRVHRSKGSTRNPTAVYFVVENDISDVQAYLKEYAVHARDMIKANGGRYIAAGDATTFVGEPPKSRVALFAFDDLQQIQTFLNSPEYKG